LKGFGIKIKILAGLSALLIIAVSSNLFFTNALLTSDKKAYIFENILTSTEGLKKTIQDQIQESFIQIESYVLLSQQSGKAWIELFEKQNNIAAFSFKLDESSVRKTFHKTLFANKPEGFALKVNKLIEEVSETDEEGISVRKIPEENLLLAQFRQGNKNLSLILVMDTLLNRISNDLVFSYIIATDAGEILWQTGEEKTNKLILSRNTGNKNDLTQEIKFGDEGFLVSSVHLPISSMKIISFISTKKAYSIVSALNFKTMAFGLILIGAALVAGLFFSIRLTKPIRSLMENAQFIADGNFEHKVEIKTKDELFVLGEKFNFMSEKIFNLLKEKEVIIDELRDANVKIEDYSKNLEKMVEERTAELKSANDFIQAMIDSLDQGLFVFDKDLKCSSIYTKACENLFNRSPANSDYMSVLQLDEDQRVKIEKWADILFSEMIPFESASMLGPKEKVFGKNVTDDDYKMLKLHYHPMRDDEQKISNVVVVATDKTAEMRAIEENKKKERYVEMIFKILGSKKQFISFTQEVEDFILSLDDILQSSPPRLDEAMLVYHSLNGGFGMYGVDFMVELARECEQFVVDLKKDFVESDSVKEKLLLDRDRLKEAYSQFKQEIFTALSIHSDQVEIDQALLMYVNDLVQESNERELKYIFSEKIMKVPVEELLTPYKELLSSLAIKLDKEFSPLKIINGETRVDPDKFQEFFAMLVHLFRNCADHGIEPPSTRDELGKNPSGTIAVQAMLDEEGRKLKLIIEDDGAGINPERIRKKLFENNPENEAAFSESDQEIIYHIFDQDFSTAEQVTSISGRGVGMSAIKDLVEKMGGQLHIESQVGVGSKFIFELPT